ncbi:serine hydrolase [Streptomyces sp. NPDC093085]|uniref:serine hydrolase n=1 Tax=Streptomyces sp. NPDC093085 TaxID=3155068 RepID=UPI0034449FF5
MPRRLPRRPVRPTDTAAPARRSLPGRAALRAVVATAVCLTMWAAAGFPAQARSADEALMASSATEGAAGAAGADPGQILDRRLAAMTKPAKTSVSVAVIDLADGREADYGVTRSRTYDTASIVKVNILVALLLRAQDEHRPLNAIEKSQAAEMIKVSDNVSASALWRAIGRGPGLDAANRRLGMTGTTGGEDGFWGLTQSTAADQITLLSAVFGDDRTSPLTAASRAYVRGLMGGIAAGQDWGVSAAGTVTGLKNGWLSRTSTGLWDVNSIGRIVVDGHSYLLAVLSTGNATMKDGITLVERAATTAIAASREWT